MCQSDKSKERKRKGRTKPTRSNRDSLLATLKERDSHAAPKPVDFFI